VTVRILGPSADPIDPPDQDRPRLALPGPVQEPVDSTEPAAEDPKMTRAEAANVTQVDHLVTLLRSAAIRGDEVTQRALIDGISKHGDAAQGSLGKALAIEKNPKARAALTRALEALN
jgi:hypothetical protein